MAKAQHNGLVFILSRQVLWGGRPMNDDSAKSRLDFDDLRQAMFATLHVITNSVSTTVDIALTPEEVAVINKLEADIVTRLSNEIVGKC